MFKPVKMWAVYTPQGTLVMPTVRGSQVDAIAAFVIDVKRITAAKPSYVWNSLLDTAGYTCRRVTVTVTPTREGGKG